MPIYEYKCKNTECEHEYELVLPMSESEDEKLCPICGALGKKQVSVNANMKANWSHWNAMG